MARRRLARLPHGRRSTVDAWAGHTGTIEIVFPEVRAATAEVSANAGSAAARFSSWSRRFATFSACATGIDLRRSVGIGRRGWRRMPVGSLRWRSRSPRVGDTRPRRCASSAGSAGSATTSSQTGTTDPFGYGQNSSAESAINRLLFGGAGIAAGLTLWSLCLRVHRLVVVNLLLGVAGGTIAGLSKFGQHESNPYCSEYGWLGDVVVAAGLLLAAGAANVLFGRRSCKVSPTK